MAQADDFTSKYLGQAVEREDPINADQCMDWAFAWVDELKIPRAAIRHEFAYQVYTEPNAVTLQYFSIVKAVPGFVPPAGALVVFSQVLGVAGHIALALSGSTATVLRTSDQNWNYKLLIQIVNHNYANVLGYLIPKQGEDMISDAPHLQALFRAFRGRPATDAEVALYVGKVGYDDLVAALDQGDERNATIYALEIGQTAVQDKWADQIHGLETQVANLKKGKHNVTVDGVDYTAAG